VLGDFYRNFVCPVAENFHLVDRRQRHQLVSDLLRQRLAREFIQVAV
jgi:hypothetical protein